MSTCGSNSGGDEEEVPGSEEDEPPTDEVVVVPETQCAALPPEPPMMCRSALLEAKGDPSSMSHVAKRPKLDERASIAGAKASEERSFNQRIKQLEKQNAKIASRLADEKAATAVLRAETKAAAKQIKTLTAKADRAEAKQKTESEAKKMLSAELKEARVSLKSLEKNKRELAMASNVNTVQARRLDGFEAENKSLKSEIKDMKTKIDSNTKELKAKGKEVGVLKKKLSEAAVEERKFKHAEKMAAMKIKEQAMMKERAAEAARRKKDAKLEEAQLKSAMQRQRDQFRQDLKEKEHDRAERRKAQKESRSHARVASHMNPSLNTGYFATNLFRQGLSTPMISPAMAGPGHMMGMHPMASHFQPMLNPMEFRGGGGVGDPFLQLRQQQLNPGMMAQCQLAASNGSDAIGHFGDSFGEFGRSASNGASVAAVATSSGALSSEIAGGSEDSDETDDDEESTKSQPLLGKRERD